MRYSNISESCPSLACTEKRAKCRCLFIEFLRAERRRKYFSTKRDLGADSRLERKSVTFLCRGSPRTQDPRNDNITFSLRQSAYSRAAGARHKTAPEFGGVRDHVARAR